MEPKLNFLIAVLAGVIIISLAMSLRSCGRKPLIPPYFEPTVSIDAAIDRAKDEERPVFALFTADWCGICTKLKQGPLSSAGVEEWVRENAIPAYVDVSKARSGDLDSKVLLTRFQVDALPTIVIIENGRPVRRVTGNIPRRELLEWLRDYSPAAGQAAEPTAPPG